MLLQLLAWEPDQTDSEPLRIKGDTQRKKCLFLTMHSRHSFKVYSASCLKCKLYSFIIRKLLADLYVTFRDFSSIYDEHPLKNAALERYAQELDHSVQYFMIMVIENLRWP